MKIVDVCRISGRGDAIITDEPYTHSAFTLAGTTTILRVAVQGRIIELAISSVEAVLKSDYSEVLGFLVPCIDDDAIRANIVGRDVELA